MSKGPGTRQRAILEALQRTPERAMRVADLLPGGYELSAYQALRRAAHALERAGLLECVHPRVRGTASLVLRLPGSDAVLSLEKLSVSVRRSRKPDNDAYDRFVQTVTERLRTRPMPTMPELLTPDDMARFLQLQRRSVLELSRCGRIPLPVRLGHRTLRWRRADVFAAFGLEPRQEASGDEKATT
jgi:predicted DNA-binding transcriptional regulator AlpA